MPIEENRSAVDFFDSLARQWDSLDDPGAVRQKLEAGLDGFGIDAEERILDVGCGTGNLTSVLLNRLGPSGRVTAIDVSGGMLAVAREKIGGDPRVTWIQGAIEEMDPSHGPFDRIICYSVWPHLSRHPVLAAFFLELLVPSGHLHIWHTISRSEVNSIHAEASDAVRNHRLRPAIETAAMLQDRGFRIVQTRDDETGYLITACKG